MKQEDLLREVEEFNNMTPSDAIDYISETLFENDFDDERLSDACKRIRKLIEEVKTASPLDMYLQEEIRFRLKEIHNVPEEKITDELVNYIDYDLLDDCEGYIDGGYMDDMIRKALEEGVNND